MASSVFAETLENLKESKRTILESRSYSLYSTSSGLASSQGWCENGKEPLISMKKGNFFTS
jgi:hypothetical protein